jgi:hypothetical protein
MSAHEKSVEQLKKTCGEKSLNGLSTQLSADSLAEVLKVLPLKQCSEPEKDVITAVRTENIVLLEHLLKELDPADCPDTFDGADSQYRTSWARRMGKALDSALHIAFENQNLRVIETLMQHDTALRSVVMSLGKYRVNVTAKASGVDEFMATSLRYSPASDTVNLGRVMSLRNRLQGTSITDSRTCNALMREVRAIGYALTVECQGSKQKTIRTHFVKAILKLGMENELVSRPLVTATGDLLPFITLVEQSNLLEGRYPRMLGDMKQFGTGIADQCSRKSGGFGLTSELKKYIEQVLGNTGRLILPIENSHGRQMIISVGFHEWRYLNNEDLRKVVVSKINRSTNAKAREIGCQLLTNPETTKGVQNLLAFRPRWSPSVGYGNQEHKGSVYV